MIDVIFDFLVSDYGFQYKKQEFHNCYGGHWLVRTYSYFNVSGCFTIHHLPSRGELEFFYAPQCSNNREELYQQRINVQSIEPELWRKYTHIGTIKRPFFWCNTTKVLTVLAEVMKKHISKHGEVFGIKIEEDIFPK